MSLYVPPSPAFRPHPAKLAERVQYAPLMATQNLTSYEALSEGKSAAFKVTLPKVDGERAFWAIQKQSNLGQSWEVNATRREAVSSVLDVLTGMGLVPTTVWLRSKNDPSIELSRQLYWRYPDNHYVPKSHDFWVGAGMKYRIARTPSEMLRAFDYWIGNRDRHGGNILLDRRQDPEMQKYVPVAIDNGLNLPNGPNHDFRWPWQGFDGHGQGGVLSTTVAYVNGLDPQAIAAVLARGNIEKEATRHAIRRVLRLKLDPSFILPGKWDTTQDSTRMWAGIRTMASSETQGLGAGTLREIDDLVEAAYVRPAVAAQAALADLQARQALYVG